MIGDQYTVEREEQYWEGICDEAQEAKIWECAKAEACECKAKACEC